MPLLVPEVDGAAALVEVVEVVSVVLVPEDPLEALEIEPAGGRSGLAGRGASCAVGFEEPQAASPKASSRPARTARSAAGDAIRRRSGSMRRPQVWQSFRSFWLSWPHQLQKRRFSTAQGSSDGVGASGSICPTTSSSSPVSRSR